MPRFRTLAPLALMLAATPILAAPSAKAKAAERVDSPLAGIPFRNLGPAVTSGRVGDIAVDPRKPDTWYVAAASGGVWKTVNGGTTWTPLFDKEGSFSIGCVTVDPHDSNTVWVGTGENNSQRSVAYGDGVYRSLDGGKHWENMGLKASEHIGKILVDPRNSQVVFVAAQGPLWKEGGERGLYKTTDGGKTWKAALTVDAHTGVADVLLDPRNPDVLYAATYQRRRHVWGMLDGGPGSGIHKSLDGGQTWKKLTEGLPKEDMGRIGLALPAGEPDTVYATIEAANKAGGFFRSLDGGRTWERRNEQVSGSAQYYQELFCDPKDPKRVYSMDTWMQVTEDGGKTWRRVGETSKHVDNHALWIDPANSDHLIAGCDGGLYESRDRGATWAFTANLPIIQYYRVATDNARPFYNVYGGTQDNFSMGGPSRTRNLHGSTNLDWFVTQGGDGFYSQVDPDDSDTVYSESQYGGLARFDRRTGERVEIQPQTAPGEEPFRWNWDAPLMLSPHNGKRLYFAAQKLFRSDDRGDSWTAVSPDLTRKIDRSRLKIMDKVWGVDAVARNTSTSFFGNIVALAESPKAEGLLYVGTDDGLLQISEDGGKVWRKSEPVPGVPDLTYVSCLAASPHRAGTVYAAFDNHKMGDFRPYLLLSGDRGRTWESISTGLPERGSVYTVREDPAREGLLFCGTEFGLFFSLDAGKTWSRFTQLPTIAVKDLTIQAREGDLVVATFGRGFYILDDLTPLREAKAEDFEPEAHLFGLRPAQAYIPAVPFGGPGKSFQGDSLFLSPNPPFGAVFTYHVKVEPKTLKQQRQAKEKEAAKAGQDPAIPTWDSLRAEDREVPPAVVLTIAASDGQVVRRIVAKPEKGLHRLAWDLRLQNPAPIRLKIPTERDPWDYGAHGALAAPGRYQATLSFQVDGVLKPVAGPVAFDVRPLDADRLTPAQWAEFSAFSARMGDAQRRALGASQHLNEAQNRLDHVRKALLETPAADPALLTKSRSLYGDLKDLRDRLSGDNTVAARQEPTAPGILGRIREVTGSVWATTQLPTATQRQNLAWAEEGLQAVKGRLEAALTTLKTLEDALEAAKAPYTPGRSEP
ncbi:WD40/YVTN/BNR-like repeat-containing protein [Geothrix fuzhouensis]|uniref:WD40/YVTN/BNR-like repeat-containing protein n=1 Tax=Geothrix fuzhouensis TaxID=2966451 RepID=UPI002148E3A0|nr:sialidase family protein [Geothrix fuzhouensis]